MYSNSNTSGYIGKVSVANGQNVYFNAPIEEFTTFDNDGAQLWYETYHPQLIAVLYKPIVYHLDPVVIKTINNVNNISGVVSFGEDYLAPNLSVSYWGH